jgi:hypothetical protein
MTASLPEIIERVEGASGERTYLIMSKKHTRPGDRWITFWRADDTGYAHRMDWFGLYHERDVMLHTGYYDNRSTTYAVPALFVSCRAVEGTDESGMAHRVPNTPRMWRKMVRAACRARALRARLATQEQQG